MNKGDLIKAVSAATNATNAEAKAAVDAVFATIAEDLKQGNAVRIIGFGTFAVRERAARTAKNPRTNETIEIPATKVPAFKAGKELKDLVNG